LKKISLAAALAASYLCVSPASAAKTVVPKDNASPGPTLEFTNDSATASFSGSYSVDNTQFDDSFFFSLSQYATLTTGQLLTQAGGSAAPFKGDLDISFVNLLSGASTVFTFSKSSAPAGTDKNELFGLPASAQGQLFAPGTYSVNLSGFADNVSASGAGGAPGPGTYTGSLSFASVATPVALAPVPEPATWAMVLVGFGAVGFGMRRRRVEKHGKLRVRFAV
jgi:hypothetical protein